MVTCFGGQECVVFQFLQYRILDLTDVETNILRGCQLTRLGGHLCLGIVRFRLPYMLGSHVLALKSCRPGLEYDPCLGEIAHRHLLQLQYRGERINHASGSHVGDRYS